MSYVEAMSRRPNNWSDDTTYPRVKARREWLDEWWTEFNSIASPPFWDDLGDDTLCFSGRCGRCSNCQSNVDYEYDEDTQEVHVIDLSDPMMSVRSW